MAEFDFDAARRWARFDPQKTLARRGDNELPFVGEEGLLLDTCVYVDQMQDRSPQVLDDLIAQRQANHSTVAIQELMHTVGVLNPSDARTEGVIPALESAHAVAEALRRAPGGKDELFVINLSGRGDKDTDIYRENLKELDEPDQNRPAL